MDELQSVFAAMGSALTRWSIADRALSAAFAEIVNPRKPRAAAAAIWRVTGLNLKVDMVEAALEAMYTDYPKGDPDPVKEKWAIARKAIFTAAKGRNDLGHSSLYGLDIDGTRKTVLQKDREKFLNRIQIKDMARHFDAAECYKIETDCLDAIVAIHRTMMEVERFYSQSRIKTNSDDAWP